MKTANEQMNHVVEDVQFDGNKWGALVQVIDEDGVSEEFRWATGSKSVREQQFSDQFPRPPAAENMIEAGGDCAECGRNMGLFPVANMCKYCRPVEQPNGDTIVGIAYFDEGEWRRLSNSSITVSEESIEISKGPYADAEILGDYPNISADEKNTFGLMTVEFPPMWWIKFSDGN